LGGRPLKAGAPVADFMSGAHLYGAIVTALYEREKTGVGRTLEVSMLEALFATMLPAAGHVYASDATPRRAGNRHVADSYVPFDAFETKDGWVTVVCSTDEHWHKLTQAMGRPDLAADEELSILAGRVARIDEVTAAVAEWARSYTRDEVCRICDENHVAAAPLQDVHELLNDVQLRSRGFLTDHETEAGVVALPNSPMRYEGSALRKLSPPPELGEHSAEVLKEFLGLDDAAIAKLRRDGVLGTATD
jgi:CoA:oxalate CoA-transferase